MSRPKVESIDPQPTSKCHHASVHVKSSDEGTSYYVCNKCGKPCDIVANYNGLTDMPQGGGAKGATSQGTGCYFNPMRHRSSHSKTTGDTPSLQPLREAILALDKLRQNHQIDNPEYVDRLVELIETREREAARWARIDERRQFTRMAYKKEATMPVVKNGHKKNLKTNVYCIPAYWWENRMDGLQTDTEGEE